MLGVKCLSLAIGMLVGSSWADAETVDVKYRGVVDLKPFACTDTPRSSFHPTGLLRQCTKLHDHKPQGHLLSLLRTAPNDV
jgi:hypothetical protein